MNGMWHLVTVLGRHHRMAETPINGDHVSSAKGATSVARGYDISRVVGKSGFFATFHNFKNVGNKSIFVKTMYSHNAS